MELNQKEVNNLACLTDVLKISIFLFGLILRVWFIQRKDPKEFCYIRPNFINLTV